MAAYPNPLSPNDLFKTLRESVNSLITDVQGITVGGSFTSMSLDAGSITTIGSSSQALIIGNTASVNLIFDSNEIQARNNGVLNDFHLNRFGGDVLIGDDIAADLYVSQNIYENSVALSAKYLGIAATAANSSQLGGAAAADFTLSTGDDITGNLILDNTIGISGRKVDTTALEILNISAADAVEVGDVSVHLELKSLDDGIINIAGTPQTLIHTGNIDTQEGGVNLALLYYIGGL